MRPFHPQRPQRPAFGRIRREGYSLLWGRQRFLRPASSYPVKDRLTGGLKYTSRNAHNGVERVGSASKCVRRNFHKIVGPRGVTHRIWGTLSPKREAPADTRERLRIPWRRALETCQ